MDLFPAIDLQNGQCVRLVQGDFNAATIYEADPLKQARKFAEAGAKWLHVVDLDGAKEGDVLQLNIIAAIARQKNLKVQAGGGIRDAATISQLFDAGAARVVVGSRAVKDPPQVQRWMRQFGPERIVLAFDVRLNELDEPEVLTHGWQSCSQVLMWDLLNLYVDSGLKTILCTDVGRDGMLTGTNHALYRTLRERWPDLAILASGGVKDQADLATLKSIGVAGAIVGKALYEGRIDLAAALAALA